MDLNRAISKFAKTEILSWDSVEEDWEPTGCYGALQVFDRFITERSFGQKKRILTVARDFTLPTDLSIVRLDGSDQAFLVEKFNEDVRFGFHYTHTYLLHEATYYVSICKETKGTNAAGVKIAGSETVVQKTWVDLERFTGIPSTVFRESDITIVNMTFPKNALVDTDSYVKMSNGDRYNVDEIYVNLELIGARGKRIGV